MLPKEHKAGSIDADLIAQAKDIASDETLPLVVREGMILALHDQAVERAQLDLIFQEYRRKDPKNDSR